MERKYRQRGYSDRDAEEKKRERAEEASARAAAPKQQDMLGPRTPRMVGTVMRARCSSCGAVLAPGFDAERAVPALPVRTALLQAVRALRYRQAVRVHAADRRARCEKGRQERLHVFRISHDGGKGHLARQLREEHSRCPRRCARPNDARKAFEDLFKK